jgi:hypothetical protein
MSVQIYDALVRLLVDEQYPQWSELPMSSVTPHE